MAFAQMSATGKDAVRAVDKAFDDEDRIDSSRAHHPNDPDMRRILKAGHAGGIGGSIAAPVAKETQDFRFESVTLHCVKLRSPSLAICHASFVILYVSTFSKGLYLGQDLVVRKAAHANSPRRAN